MPAPQGDAPRYEQATDYDSASLPSRRSSSSTWLSRNYRTPASATDRTISSSRDSTAYFGKNQHVSGRKVALMARRSDTSRLKGPLIDRFVSRPRDRNLVDGRH